MKAFKKSEYDKEKFSDLFKVNKMFELPLYKNVRIDEIL